MLLKDYKHAVYFVDREGSIKEEDIEKRRRIIIAVEAEVVIKREGKHYTVPFFKRIEVPLKEYCADLLTTFLTQCRYEMEKIDQNWKLVGEIGTLMNSKVLAETPIEL